MCSRVRCGVRPSRLQLFLRSEDNDKSPKAFIMIRVSVRVRIGHTAHDQFTQSWVRVGGRAMMEPNVGSFQLALVRGGVGIIGQTCLLAYHIPPPIHPRGWDHRADRDKSIVGLLRRVEQLVDLDGVGVGGVAGSG